MKNASNIRGAQAHNVQSLVISTQARRAGVADSHQRGLSDGPRRASGRLWGSRRRNLMKSCPAPDMQVAPQTMGVYTSTPGGQAAPVQLVGLKGASERASEGV